MTYRLLFILFLLWPGLQVHAQYEKVWIFGSNAGLDFNNNTPDAIKTAIPISNLREAAASICDANGQLLFYTEGDTIWDRNGNIMPNGRGLTGLPRLNSDMSATTSTGQGALIIRAPNSMNKYYVFSLSSTEMKANSGRLYYSVVDMDLNNGLGDVVAGQKGILVETGLTEHMAGVVGNHCDAWVIVIPKNNRNANGNQFKVFEITDAGVSTTPVISSVGGTYIGGFFGKIDVSPSRKRLAVARLAIDAFFAFGGPVELYDFNPDNGQVTNQMILGSYNTSNPLCQGVCFSPDNTKLYINKQKERQSGIFQFDLSSNNTGTIISSLQFIDSTSGGHDLKRGPDGKIYYISSEHTIGVINHPDLPGPACAPNGSAVQLVAGTASGLCLPNNAVLLKQNTILTSRLVTAGCFAMQQLLQAADVTGWDYTWNDDSSRLQKTVSHPGTYWVRYHTPPCNLHVDTFQVIFPNGVLPDIHIQNACRGSSDGKAWAATYTGDTVTYHYVWQNSNGDTLSTTDSLKNIPSEKYTLQVRTAHCDTTLSFFLPRENHSVSFLSDSIICQGTELRFQNTSDSSFTQFLWDFGDEDDSELRNPDHIYKHSGSYEVTLIGKGKMCTDTANKTITVDSLFSGTFLTEPDSICAGEKAISFYPQIDSSALSLHWQFGDGTEMIPGRENKIQHAYQTAGSLAVRLIAHFRACPDTSFTDTVYVYPLPKVDLGPDTGLCLHGAPIILQNRQTFAAGIYHYHWSTGDTTEKIKVVHPGMYHLTVSEAPLNCSNSASIKITKDCYIDIPNAFTPNGDGENDYFFPRQLLSQKITQFKMQIFNRWGELIFETTKTNGRGWDGTFNGKPQPEGVYVYVIYAEIDGTRQEHYQGNVTLLK